MKIFLIIAMAFAAPMAGIAIFIVIDKGLDKFCNWLKNKNQSKGQSKNLTQITPLSQSQNPKPDKKG